MDHDDACDDDRPPVRSNPLTTVGLSAAAVVAGNRVLDALDQLTRLQWDCHRHGLDPVVLAEDFQIALEAALLGEPVDLARLRDALDAAAQAVAIMRRELTRVPVSPPA